VCVHAALELVVDQLLAHAFLLAALAWASGSALRAMRSQQAAIATACFSRPHSSAYWLALAGSLSAILSARAARRLIRAAASSPAARVSLGGHDLASGSGASAGSNGL
jgi:hypothetical protein